MQKCPNCGELTFGKYDQCFIGPAIHKKCRSCGAKVSTPYISCVIGIMMVIVMHTSRVALPSPMNIILIIITGILGVVLSCKFTPLIVKK